LPPPCHWAAAITTAPAIGAIGTTISIAAIITVIMAITARTAITAAGAEALTPDSRDIGGFAAGQPAAPLRVDTAPAAVMPNLFRDPLNR
jgi:hypothetical protein